MSVKTNERELSGEVKAWFQAEIDRNKYTFKTATNEAGTKTGKVTRFGDIVLWHNREANEAFMLLELKPPFGAVENLSTLTEKAISLKVKYACTWDFQNLHVYEIKEGKLLASGLEATPILNKIDDWLRGDKQAIIKSYINRFCIEFEKLNATGKFIKFSPDKVFFVNLIRGVVNKLTPLFITFIQNQYGELNKKKKIDEYVVKQGINYSSSEAFFELLASQRVYGLVTKTIFYLTIRRYFQDLPPIVQDDTDFNVSLKVAFAKAREKDWQAVFEDGPIDELGIPEATFGILEEFLNELTVYHFGELPEDVLGELFQEIIDPDKRHTLGQYFTPENLVDFVIALVVNDPGGVYCDPTCGSGTFLIRLYDRLRYLKPSITHAQMLSQIWGFDIASFPAELSTINLFRQEASNFENFPRVRVANIFDVYKGITFDFPPPNAGKQYFKVQETLPEITGFVGNFPFIRQELIEKKDPEFKKNLTKLLAYEYLVNYPQLFVLKNGVGKGSSTKEGDYEFFSDKKSIDSWVEKGWIELKLSSQADLYTYIYIHLTTLLSKQGTFAIITSNSWLDVAYGAVLKQFFLDHFRIKAIIGSWAEPWFNDAAVNCVITVLEREDDAEKRNLNITNFVKLKQPIKELVPFGHEKYESYERWKALDALERIISNAQYLDENRKEINVVDQNLRSFENVHMRIRMASQAFLGQEVAEKQETSKWGKFLRAPDVYFEILDRCKDKLKPLKQFADVKFGIKTGINDFFYLKPLEEFDSNKRSLKVQNGRGYECEIEIQYLKKVIKSPKESHKILLDESFKSDILLFVCNSTMDELLKLNHFGARNYIEWGEKQRNKEGILYPEVSSVSGRKNWYSLRDSDAPQYIVPCGIGDIYKVFENKTGIQTDKRLYELNTQHRKLKYFLNSTLYAFFVECECRVNLGDGLIDLTVYEVENIPTVDIELINSYSDKILKPNYDKISAREIKPINKEIHSKERQLFDSELIAALGLNPKEILPLMYESLEQLWSERIELPKMRDANKKRSVKIAYDEIKKSVIKDILPNGFKTFPHAFADFNSFTTYSLPTSGKMLKVQTFFMGSYILVDSSGQTIADVYGEAAAQYAVAFSKTNLGKMQIPMPEHDNTILEILNNYKQYRQEIYQQVRQNAYQKLHDWNLADKMAKEIIGE